MISLVTGATGFIGSHLVERLVSDGGNVRVLVRQPRRKPYMPPPGVEVSAGDLTDRESLRRALDGVKRVYHAGALVSDWGRGKEFFSANVDGTRNLMEECLAANVTRFVYLSSASVYGYPKAELIDESMPYMKRGIPYIDSKIEAEKLLFQYNRERGLPAVALRPTQVYGPRCVPYVREIVAHILDGSMLLLDGGRYVAGLCYVGNLVDALILAGSVPSAAGMAFNISDGSAVTWKRYINALARLVGKGPVTRSLPSSMAYTLAWLMETGSRAMGKANRPLLTRLAVLELGREQNYDISSARSVLGYEPSVQFAEGISRVADWLRREGLI